MARLGLVDAVLKESGPFLEYFNTGKGRRGRINDAIRAALIAGGAYWLSAFMPKRFSEYAKRLGYRVSKKWENRKRRIIGWAMPYIGLTGFGKGSRGYERMADAVNRSKVMATSTSSKGARMVVTVPFGHPVPVQHSAWFRFIPTWEEERVAKKVEESLEQAMLNAPTQSTKRSPVNMIKRKTMTRPRRVA